jgi:hypothetical protein
LRGRVGLEKERALLLQAYPQRRGDAHRFSRA